MKHTPIENIFALILIAVIVVGISVPIIVWTALILTDVVLRRL